MISSFQKTCKKIEEDPNYGQVITPNQLTFIAYVTLQATDLGTVIYSSEEPCNLGRLYNILQVCCTSPDFRYKASSWSVSTYQLLVSKDGEVSFYKDNGFKHGKIAQDLSLDKFLGQSHVVDAETKRLTQFAKLN